MSELCCLFVVLSLERLMLARFYFQGQTGGDGIFLFASDISCSGSCGKKKLLKFSEWNVTCVFVLLCTLVYLYMCTFFCIYVYLHVCAIQCTYTYICSYMHISIYDCTSVHMYTCTNLHMYTCSHVSTYLCKYENMYMCIDVAPIPKYYLSIPKESANYVNSDKICSASLAKHLIRERELRK